MRHSKSNPVADFYLDASRRGVEPRQGQIGHAQMHVKAIDESRRQIHFVCSTGEVDHYGEIVEPSAFEASIPAFMSNPVFQAGHVYVGPSGEPSTIGHWEKVVVTNNALEGIAEFDDEDPLAQRYWNLYKKGHMRACSVGFIAVAWEMRDVEIEGRQQRVRVFTKVNLLEISAVAVGANPSALVRVASALRHAPDTDLSDDMERLAKALEPFFERTLKTILHAGPGGLLCSLLQDILEAQHGHAELEHEDLDDIYAPGDQPPRTASDKGDPEFKTELRDLLATAKERA